MTFREQVRWCRKWGAAALLLVLALLGMLYLLADTLDRNALELIATLCTAIAFIAAVLIILGGLARPLQKAFYHYAFEGNDRTRRQLAINPMALWLWIDLEGRDRDA